MAKIMKIHILGIAGTMTAPLALELQKQGHIITGSDQEKIYPPISDFLKNILLNQKLPIKIDLCIVGSSYNKFKKTREEFQYIHDNHIPYMSATNYIANNVSKTNSILIAGTFGKTSITSLLAWNFTKAGFNPSYMFGGIAKNNFPSLTFTNSDYSIIEADESINGLDKQAKFLYYPVKYLILTSASWEHKESYATAETNFNTFKKLIEKLPSDGLLIANKKGENIKKLVKHSVAPVIFYESDNEIAVKLMCDHFCIPFSNDFPGIMRRLDLISNKNDILIYDDFAQSSDRIQYVIKTLLKKHPQYNIKVLFEPHASHLQYSIKGLGKALRSATEIVLSKISFNLNQKITFKQYRKEIGDKIIYLPLEKDIIKHYQNTLKPLDLLIHFSSSSNNICQNI